MNEQQKQNVGFRRIVVNLCSSSLQITLGYICLDILFSITLHFVALEIGEKEAAGVGLSFSIIGIFIMPMGIGINECLNLVASQALGANQKQLSLSFLNLTFWTHLMYCIPFSFIIYLSRDLIQMSIPVSDRQEVIQAAWEYLPWLLISTYLAINFEGFKCYLLAHKVFQPFIFIHIFTTGLHYFNNQLFITQLKMGLQGAGLSLIITEATNIVILIVYISITTDKKQNFHGFVFFFPYRKGQLFISFLETSLPMVLHIYSQFIIFYFLGIYSLQLGTLQFYAQMILQNINYIFFRFALGLNYALLIFVGNSMGELQHKIAQKYVLAGCQIFVGLYIILFIPFWVFQSQWKNFFSNDEIVIQIITDTLIVFSVSLFLEGIKSVVSGSLKGIDKASLVSNATLVVSYLICLDIQYILALPFIFWLFSGGMKIKAIWIGYVVANIILNMLFIWVLLSSDWVRQEQIISDRIQEQCSLQKSKYLETDPLHQYNSINQEEQEQK